MIRSPFSLPRRAFRAMRSTIKRHRTGSLPVGTYQGFLSPYQSPQLYLWQGEDILWRPAYKLDSPPRRAARRRLETIQYRLFSEEAE
jgi:hypothetical protein